jgi:hypothetical protein
MQSLEPVRNGQSRRAQSDDDQPCSSVTVRGVPGRGSSGRPPEPGARSSPLAAPAPPAGPSVASGCRPCQSGLRASCSPPAADPAALQRTGMGATVPWSSGSPWVRSPPRDCHLHKFSDTPTRIETTANTYITVRGIIVPHANPNRGLPSPTRRPGDPRCYLRLPATASEGMAQRSRALAQMMGFRAK